MNVIWPRIVILTKDLISSHWRSLVAFRNLRSNPYNCLTNECLHATSSLEHVITLHVCSLIRNKAWGYPLTFTEKSHLQYLELQKWGYLKSIRLLNLVGGNAKWLSYWEKCVPSFFHFFLSPFLPFLNFLRNQNFSKSHSYTVLWFIVFS